MVVGQGRDARGRASSLGELLLGFSALTSVGLGQDPEHGLRTCYIGMRLGDALGVRPDDRAGLYYAALAKDAGCTCGATQMALFLGTDERVALADAVRLDPDNELQMLLWLFRHAGGGSGTVQRTRRLLGALVHGRRFEREAAEGECEVARRIAMRLGLRDESAAALAACTERWDGRGVPTGVAGEGIPLAARVINLAAYAEITHRLSGRDAAVALVRQRSGRAFDPAMCEAFLRLAGSEAFWAPLETEASFRERVIALEPEDGRLPAGPQALDRFVEAVADLVALKHPAGAGHGRRVAELATRAGRRLGLDGIDVLLLRRAALIHDAGLLALSAHLLAQGGSDGDPAYRNHPVTVLHLLGGVPELEAACALAALHHERADGTGYPAGVRGETVSVPARILAAACAADESGSVEPLFTTGFDRRVAEAVAAELGAAAPKLPAEWPAGLTDREVEVLRLAASGLSVREIARRLVISHHTVRHHLESIYAKSGVRTRAAAALFAAEHGLLG